MPSADLDEHSLSLRARAASTGDAYSPYLPLHRRAMRRALIAIAVAIVNGAASASDRAAIDAALDELAATQRPSGLFAGGDNGESPPDCAFTANDLARALRLLRARPTPGLESCAARLREIAMLLAPALRTGGVHTPNHRWELAAALAALGDVLGEAHLTRAAEVWLAEGVDIDADGMFSERSANYAAHVSGPSLLLLSRLLGRDELAAAVERNLRATLPLIDARGRVETVHSRRQDQTVDFDAEPYLPLLRWAARRTRDPRFTAVADAILGRGLHDPGSRLVELLDEQTQADGRGDLPPGGEPPAVETTLVLGSGLVRWKDRDLTTTLFGGSDFAATGRIASGLSNSSVLIRSRRGDLELRALRISPEFFGIGALRPRLTHADASVVTMRETRSAAFYGPLPAERRRRLGDYALTPDGRFFAAMDFAARPRQSRSLDTTVTVTRTDEGFELDARWDGLASPVAFELVFPASHTVTGTAVRPDLDALVPTGTSIRVMAPDGAEMRISWQGAGAEGVAFDEGESFTAVGGQDRVAGTRVLIPAHTAEEFHLAARFGDGPAS